MKSKSILLGLIFGLPLAVGGLMISQQLSYGKDPVMEVVAEKPEEPQKKVVKTDEEWKSELTPEQYRILRQSGTERPFGKVYKEFNAQGEGEYICAGCNVELFSSKQKLDAHSGWPSFYDAAQAENVKLVSDVSAGMVRTEVRCAICDGHLGHVFEGEGYETPTDLRYCINGAILKFVPASSDVNEAKPSASESTSEEN